MLRRSITRVVRVHLVRCVVVVRQLRTNKYKRHKVIFWALWGSALWFLAIDLIVVGMFGDFLPHRLHQIAEKFHGPLSQWGGFNAVLAEMFKVEKEVVK